MMTRNGTNSVIRHAANDRNHKARFLCCFASSWLVSVVLIESLIMVGWVVREYHVFDYTCIIARPNKSFGEMSGPRIIYAATDKQVRKRNLRVIEVNSSLTGHVPFVVDGIADQTGPLLVGTTKQEDFVFSNPGFHENLAKLRKKREAEDEVPSSTVPTMKKRRKLKKRIRTTPKPAEEALTTIESVVSIEQLPISDSKTPNGIKTIRAKTTKIKHVLQDPPSTFGKKLKRRKKLKSTPSAESAEVQESQSAEPTFAEVPNSMEEPVKFGTKIRRFKSKNGPSKKQNLGKRVKPKPEIPLGNQTLPTVPSVTTTSSTANSTNSSLMAEAIASAIGFGLKDDKKSEEKSETSPPTTKETPTTTPETLAPETKPVPVLTVEDSQFQIVAPNKPPGFQPEAPPNKFETSLAEFSTLALCAGRVALDIWCVAQLVAAVPFLIGICLRSQCLLFVRLMLDALFLVILFVYAITVIAFSVILYVLVDEMTTEVVCEWLVFGLLLTAVLLVAIAVFGVVLRCCELIVNERPKTKNKRSKSLLYTEIGSEQLLEAADEI